WLDLDLVDPGQLVLDRGFDGNDVACDRIELKQPGIECCRLAAACRPGHEHHAVWQFEGALESLPDVLWQTKFHKIELDRGAVEHPQHDGLAVERGHGRDTEVDIMAADREPDTPVLRQPAFSD